MADLIERTHTAISRASDTTDDETVRKKLRSIDEGLRRLATDGQPDGDRLEELEKNITRLLDETDNDTKEWIQVARDRLDEYRRTYTREWDEQ